MFKIIGTKLYFNEWEVATLDPWLRESVRLDLIHELENHTKADIVQTMLRRITDLELALAQTDDRELAGASWS